MARGAYPSSLRHRNTTCRFTNSRQTDRLKLMKPFSITTVCMASGNGIYGHRWNGSYQRMITLSNSKMGHTLYMLRCPQLGKSVMFTATAVTFTHSIAHLFNTLSESKRPIRLLKDQLRESVFAPTNHVAVVQRQHSVHCPKWPPVVHTKHCVKVAVVSCSCKAIPYLAEAWDLTCPCS